MSPPRTRIPGRRLLNAPGPTPLPDEVLHALQGQPVDLADGRLDANIAVCEAGLRTLLGAPDATVLLYAANGHGAWEAAAENVLPPDAAVLIPGTGHFSESWAVQTEALGRKVVRTPWHAGLPIDPAAVEQALREDRQHRVHAVFAVHTDTASGITSDLAALRAAIDAAGHPALFVVDAVASAGATPVAMDRLGADVVLGASQKALMAPPGIAWVAANRRAMAAARANPAPRFYWDFDRRDSELSYRKFCGTAPQNTVAALAAGLTLIEAEGLEAVYARHRLLSQAVQACVQGWTESGPLRFFAQRPETRSVSVTTVAVPEGFDVDAMRTLAREHFGLGFAGALGPLAGKAFRIAHLGDQNASSMLGTLGAMEAALRVLGLPIGRDGLARAVDVLAAGVRPA